MGKPGSRSDLSTKFEKKLDFYAKVKDKVSTLTTHKTIVKKKKLRSRQKKLKAYDLSTLTEFLPELKDEQKPTPPSDLKRNCKSMRKLILKEGKQLTTVLNHPAFQSDALAAIHQHLERTQPAREEEKRKGKTNVEARRKVHPYPNPWICESKDMWIRVCLTLMTQFCSSRLQNVLMQQF